MICNPLVGEGKELTGVYNLCHFLRNPKIDVIFILINLDKYHGSCMIGTRQESPSPDRDSLSYSIGLLSFLERVI
jgi:hypothetical protein